MKRIGTIILIIIILIIIIANPLKHSQAVEDSPVEKVITLNLYNNTVSGDDYRGFLMSGNYTVKTLGFKKMDEVLASNEGVVIVALLDKLQFRIHRDAVLVLFYIVEEEGVIYKFTLNCTVRFVDKESVKVVVTGNELKIRVKCMN